MRLITHISAALALLITQPVLAQSWTVGSQTPTYSVPPVIGDGVDRHAEVSSAAQGGDPPALAYEPAVIDQVGYTRSQWIDGNASRSDQGEAKFRFTCQFSHFSMADPIVAPGNANGPHHHTFLGNMGTNENSSYSTLRNSPASSCRGGPVGSPAYWEPTLFYEAETGVNLPVKPNVASFYYTGEYADAPKLYRLLRGLAFIGGVNPADRLNTIRLAEIPDSAGWDKTKRYNGWYGWQCYNTVGGVNVPPDGANTADVSDHGFPRQLVNADGSDPWAGNCEGTTKILVANLNAPSCWDGKNLTSVGGRDHFRYEIMKADNSYTKVCPSGWWKVPHFEVKTEFPNGHVGLGVSGHAWRSKLYFSSDRMDPNPVNWHPRGSTFHFDWMNGWDSVAMATWLRECSGVAINGNPGNPLTCNDSTISATENLIGGTPPVGGLSMNPIITFYNHATTAARDTFGPVEAGVTVDATVTHNHN